MKMQIIFRPLTDNIYGSLAGVIAVVAITIAPQTVVANEKQSLSLIQKCDHACGKDRRMTGEHSLAISDDGRFVYGTRDVERALLVYERQPMSGRLSLVQSFTDKYDGAKTLENPELLDLFYGPRAVTLSPDNRHLFLALYSMATVLVFERNKESGKLRLVQRIFDKDQSIGLCGPTDFAFSSNGAFVFVPCTGNSAIVGFRRDKERGQLSKVDAVQDDQITDVPDPVFGQPLPGARKSDGLDVVYGTATSPDGKHLYATSPRDHALTVFACDSDKGKLENVQTIKDREHQFGLEYVCTVTVSGDGRFIYCSTLGTDGALSVFERDPKTGKVEFVEVHRDKVNGVEGLRCVRTIAIAPNAERVYCADHGGRGISIFDRDKDTGRLKFVVFAKNDTDGIRGLHQVSDLVISPDGKHLYAASNEASVAVFDIRPAKMAE